MLKIITNKFSPEVIFTIIFPNQGIANIEAIGECSNLMVLNLNKNNVENIVPLKKCKKLRIVNLSDNCLKDIDALHNCEELVNLQLQGNLIKSIDELRAIKTCPELRNIHLQSLAGDGDNPLCQLNSYRNNILA